MSYLFDTNIIIYFLKGTSEVDRFFNPAFVRDNNIFVSVITRMELLSFPALTRKEEQRIIGLLANFTVVSLTPDVEQSAIKLRKSHKLKIPDAIIAATALTIEATLVTRNISDYHASKRLRIENPFTV